MTPIYCAESLERIPPEFFLQGKAVWCAGRPYLLEQALQLHLKPDPAPPPEFLKMLGLAPAANGAREFAPHRKPEPSIAEALMAQTMIGPQKPAGKFELLLAQELEEPKVGTAIKRVDLCEHASPQTAVVLGRNEMFAAFFISNLRISRRHCMIWQDGENVFVKDLNSANKTFLDGIALIPDTVYLFLQNQMLTMGAMHSATRVFLEKSAPVLLREKAEMEQTY